MLLHGPEGSQKQSPHESGEALTGELCLVSPCLGWSQRLLNRDHHQAYYEVKKSSWQEDIQTLLVDQCCASGGLLAAAWICRNFV